MACYSSLPIWTARYAYIKMNKKKTCNWSISVSTTKIFQRKHWTWILNMCALCIYVCLNNKFEFAIFIVITIVNDFKCYGMICSTGGILSVLCFLFSHLFAFNVLNSNYASTDVEYRTISKNHYHNWKGIFLVKRFMCSLFSHTLPHCLYEWAS